MINKIIVTAFALLLFSPLLVYAQPSGTGTATTQTPLPTYSGVDSSIKDYLCTPTGDGSDLERCINRLYRFGITAGALVLVFFVVVAGYFYITGGETGKGKAKGILMNCLTGMGILLGSYALLYFINPNLASFRPIQPPIFSADDLPSCAEVGLGESCVTTDGGISFGGATCEMPIEASSVTGYNNSVHNPWDNNPETPDRHRTVRQPPNAPPPEGAVDLTVARQSPVYSPVSGKVDVRRNLGDGTGSYITVTTDIAGSGCSAASGCANLAHIDPSVNAGDTVKAGQQVGVTTQYRGSLGPHLHLELKLGGQWLTGDGKKGTWDNMKAAISRCKSSTVGGGAPGAGGNPPIDTSKAPSGMVEVNSTTHPGIQFDMKYASTDNFTGAKLYSHGKCYLTSSTADKLKKAQANLRSRSANKNLLVYDCYRPVAVQTLMNTWAGGTATWAPKKPTKPKSDYVPTYIAEPNSGKHPLGQAVDLTITGSSMPSAFDTFNTTSRYSSSNTDAKLLREVMTATSVGFSSYDGEWWHFSN